MDVYDISGAYPGQGMTVYGLPRDFLGLSRGYLGPPRGFGSKLLDYLDPPRDSGSKLRNFLRLSRDFPGLPRGPGTSVRGFPFINALQGFCSSMNFIIFVYRPISYHAVVIECESLELMFLILSILFWCLQESHPSR